MFALLFLAVGLACCLAKPVSDHYSYSSAVGLGSGTAFASEGEGHITAVRVWEIANSYITGIQLRYDLIWSPLSGRKTAIEQEVELFEGEAIIQVSGKFHPRNYIYQLIFVTSRGRSLVSGQPVQRNFNFYPTHPEAELRMLSGRHNGNGITSLGAHWGVVNMGQGYGNETAP